MPRFTDRKQTESCHMLGAEECGASIWWKRSCQGWKTLPVCSLLIALPPNPGPSTCQESAFPLNHTRASEVQFCKLQTFWKRGVVMVTQQCDCTYYYRTMHLKTSDNFTMYILLQFKYSSKNFFKAFTSTNQKKYVSVTALRCGRILVPHLSCHSLGRYWDRNAKMRHGSVVIVLVCHFLHSFASCSLPQWHST